MNKVITLKRSFLNILSGLLLGLTMVRVLTVCLADPIAAYANNYDFVRQSSCIGLWENYKDRSKTQAHPEAPVNDLIYDRDRRPDVCLSSSDNLIPWLVARLHGKKSHLQLREIGLAKAILVLVLLAATLLQPIEARVRFALVVATAIVFGDIAIISYFNTLYLDFSVIGSAFFGIALAIVVFARQYEPGWGTLCLLLLVFLWLGFARQQYSYFSVFLGLIVSASWFIVWQQKRVAAVLLGSAIALGAVLILPQGPMNSHTRQIDRANRTDTFLGAVLPAAHEQDMALRVVDLPQSCRSSIGRDWYSPGFQIENPCPAVYALGRLRLLRLFAYDAQMMTQPLSAAVRSSRPFYLSYLGHFERPEDAHSAVFRCLVLTSFSTALGRLSGNIYFFLVTLVSVCGPICLGSMLVWQFIKPDAAAKTLGAALIMAGLGGSFAAYALVSSVFGDGYIEMPRHAVGLLIGLAFSVAAVIHFGFAIVDYFRRGLSPRPAGGSAPRSAQFTPPS